MASIEVTVNSPSRRTRFCTVVITNCNARYAGSMRQKINDKVPAQFPDVPPGTYYIIVVPEGGEAHQKTFRKIDETSDVTSVTFNLTINPVGRITAIVLVGGQRTTGGDFVAIRCAENGYESGCMTDIDGVAAFEAVPEKYVYDISAYHSSASLVDTCDLKICGDCKKQFDFSA